MAEDGYDPWAERVLPHTDPGAQFGELPSYDRLDPLKVMEDAGSSTFYYLHNARMHVEREFGPGAALQMPGVAAALVTAQATEVSAVTLAGVLLRATCAVERLEDRPSDCVSEGTEAEGVTE